MDQQASQCRYLEVGTSRAALSGEEDCFDLGKRLVHEAAAFVKSEPICLALLFTSVKADLHELASGIRAALPSSATFLGVTTAGEICGVPMQGSAVLTLMASRYLRVASASARGVSHDWRRAVQEVTSSRSLSKYFISQSELFTEIQRQGRSVFGLMFSPGNTRSSDSFSFEILEELKRLARGRIPFMGGAAADDWLMERNFVIDNGQVVEDGLLVAVVETELRFGMAMAHGFSPTKAKTLVTRSGDHTVLEMDHRPAADRYSELLGLKRQDLEGKHITLTTGKLAGIPVHFQDHALNVASFFTEDGGVRFAQPIMEGTQITIMEPEEERLIEAGREAIHDAMMRGEITRPALALVFSCALREKILGEARDGELDRIRATLPHIPVMGFYSFGEQGISGQGMNIHNNGAITTLVLGSELSGPAVTAAANRELIQQLNHRVEELAKARSEISKLNTFLRAIRNVNQIIVKERDASSLLQEVCRQFSREEIFDGAFIVLFDQAGGICDKFWHGLDDRIDRFITNLDPHEQPYCFRRLRQEPAITFYSAELGLPPECSDCSLLADGCSGILAGPILYDSRILGGLFLVNPKLDRLDQQWQSLMEEICGDIGYGIHFIATMDENQRVHRKLEQLTQAIENSAEMVMITDADGNILYVNPAFEKISGFSREEALGENPRMLKSGRHSKEFYEELWHTILSGRAWRGEIVNKRKDGSFVLMDSTISPIKGEDGTIQGFVAVMRDATEKRRLEERLRRSQKLEAIGTLAAGIAHDFNNILTSIVGHAELCTLKLQDQEARQNLEQIIKAGMRARDLVKQILTYARQTKSERRKMALTPMVKEITRFLKASLPPNIEIGYTIETDEDTIEADGSQIYQVLMNLCTNAAQAMDGKGGKLEITVFTRDISAEESLEHPDVTPGRFLAIAVSDTGCGMPEIILDRIFDPYFTTKRAEEGTGLGLSVVQGIVQAHGGFVTVESRLGEGSTFIVYLPLASAGQEDDHDSVTSSIPAPGSGTILLVDDEPTILNMVSKVLEHLGYAVRTAKDGQEALEIFMAAPDDFDLVITDLGMPRMTGDRLARMVKETRPAIPVILATGYNDRNRTAALEEGAVNAIILKPFTINDLAEKIRSALGQDD